MAETPIWKFRSMQAGEMNIDPIEAEFFSTEALGSLADALVREAIQNSLDARLPQTQVRIRFAFSVTSSSLNGRDKNPYIAGLWQHLAANRSGLTRLPSPDEPMKFMVIEDFGTRGLQGDTKQSEDLEIEAPGAKNDFYYFWRNIGRSPKQSSDLGRWGLGKTVFPAASRVNSFVALSIRANDKRRVLMGQSVLKVHKLESQRYYPYGYFGIFDQEFSLPVENNEFLDKFCRDFHIARTDESGLSVVLPYPDNELTPQLVVPSIVHHYFLPILAGKLVVQIEHDGKTVNLNANSLPKLLDEIAVDESLQLQKLIGLAKWGLTTTRESYAHVAPPIETSAPRWVDNSLDDGTLLKISDLFSRGERIAVSVPVWVKQVSAKPILSKFEIYLERDDSLISADEHFIRDGITIAAVRGSLQKGIRAIVVVHDKALSALLGDSENPAHTEWQERSPKFKDKYHHGPYTLRYIKNAPREIVRLLTRPSEGRDFKLLMNLFSHDMPTEDTVNKSTNNPADKGRHEKTTMPGDIETVGKDRFFHLQKLRGGFRITGTGDGKIIPRNAAVWVAYELRRGNPFKQYQTPDFEMNKPPVEIKNDRVDVTRAQGNMLLLRIHDPNFQLTVKGFDIHRDIRVKVLDVDDIAGI